MIQVRNDWIQAGLLSVIWHTSVSVIIKIVFKIGNKHCSRKMNKGNDHFSQEEKNYFSHWKDI